MSEASDAKDAAMRLVEDNADPGWKHVAAAAVLAVARRQELLTSEDVREHLARAAPGVETHELRALGPVMLAAARGGLIAKHSFGFYGARSRHQAPCQIWQSLIYDAPPATLF